MSVFGGDGVYFYNLVKKKNVCGILSLGKAGNQASKRCWVLPPAPSSSQLPKADSRLRALCTCRSYPCEEGAFETGVGGALPSSVSPFLLTQSLCWVSPLETLFSFPPQFGPCRYNWISRFSLSKAGLSPHCCTGQKRKREEIDATISKLRFLFFLTFWCGFPCRPLLRPPSRWWWPPPAPLLPLLRLWLSCGFLTCGLSWGCPIRLFSEGRGLFVN